MSEISIAGLRSLGYFAFRQIPSLSWSSATVGRVQRMAIIAVARTNATLTSIASLFFTAFPSLFP
jgi:hypothetical protein